MKLTIISTSLLAVVTQTFAFSSWQRPPTALLRTYPKATIPSRRSNLPHLHNAADSEFAEAFQYNLRKNRLSVSYKATAIAYSFCVIQNLLVQTSVPYACFLASEHALASGLAFILSKASAQDNLFLFTSKRYNLALLNYSACHLAGAILAGLVPGKNLFLYGPLLAAFSSIQGYTLGVRGWTYEKPVGAIVADLKKTTSQTLSSLVKVPKSIQSFGYLGATLLLATMKFAKLKEIVDILIAKSDVRTSLLVPLASFGRLALFTCVAYTLKDGSDRGLLGSTNLIQLNLLSAGSFAALASYVGINTQVGGLSAIFSLFCALNGVLSFFKNGSKE